MMMATAPDVFSDFCTYEERTVGEEEEDDSERTDTEKFEASSREKMHSREVELDPLRDEKGPKLVGSFREKVAHAAFTDRGMVYLASILSLLFCEAAFEKECELEGMVPEPWKRCSSRVAPGNIRELVGWEWLELSKTAFAATPMRAVELVAVRWASLFTLPKANGKMRVITNGIPGNEALKRPPYFKFFSPEDVVARLRQLGVFYSVSVDIRHHYHRLKMNRRMGAYYVVRTKQGDFVPNVLPMGATFAPAMGQTSTLAVVARVPRGKGDLGLVVPEGEIPAVLEIRQGGSVVGFVFICVDNISVVCKDPELRAQWWKRLKENAVALGVAPFKEEILASQKDYQFIGIHYMEGKWRHSGDRIARWVGRYGSGGGELRALSNKDLQRFVGVLVWDVRLRVKDMATMREVFDIQARVLRGEKPSQKDWELLQERWISFRENPWQEWPDTRWPPATKNRQKVVIVTDASDGKWSWLEMDAGRVVGGNPSGGFPKAGEKDSVVDKIYYKEFYAIILAARELALEGRKDIDLVLVGDSRAVIGSINKGLSPKAAWWMIDELKRLATEGGWGIQLKWVESDGNAAHPATHNEKQEQYRLERSWLVAIAEAYPPPKAEGNPNCNKKRPRE